MSTNIMAILIQAKNRELLPILLLMVLLKLHIKIK